MVHRNSNGLQHMVSLGVGSLRGLTGWSPAVCKSATASLTSGLTRILTGLLLPRQIKALLLTALLIWSCGQLTSVFAASAASNSGGGCAINSNLAPTVSAAPDETAMLSTRTPSVSDLECLKRFVNECVQIKPGSDRFTAEFNFGPAINQTSAAWAVTIKMTYEFRICRYETTQELYRLIMQKNPSRWKGPRNSVESMTFADAQQFCKAITARLHSENLISSTEEVRLPTELEWEYCCRAGTASLYSFGDKAATASDREPRASLLDAFAWHTGNAAGNDPAVGVLKPNDWGLYDMHGYLWEFVSSSADRPANAADSATTTAPANATLALPQNSQTSKSQQNLDSVVPLTGNQPAEQPVIVVRGGSWKDHYSKLNSASRQTIPEETRDDAIGFRCVIAKKP